MRFLAPDSPFSKTVTTIVKLLLLNFYIVAASIPLITIAPALTAGFTIVRDLTEKKPFIHITARYWKSFAANLRHGLVISLLIGAMVYLIWLDLQLRQAYPAMSVMWIISLVALCLVAVIQFLYLFPLEARYENPLRTALKTHGVSHLAFPSVRSASARQWRQKALFSSAQPYFSILSRRLWHPSL